MSALYYYVCDECGNIADISETPHGEDSGWICEHDGDDEHGESTLSEFRDKAETLAYSDRTRNLHYAAKMARLDQAIARADEMIVRSKAAGGPERPDDGRD